MHTPGAHPTAHPHHRGLKEYLEWSWPRHDANVATTYDFLRRSHIFARITQVGLLTRLVGCLPR